MEVECCPIAILLIYSLAITPRSIYFSFSVTDLATLGLGLFSERGEYDQAKEAYQQAVDSRHYPPHALRPGRPSLILDLHEELHQS